MNWLTRLRNSLRPPTRPTTNRYRPALDVLEDRAVPSASSSLAQNFKGNAIPAGDTLWFSAVGQVGGLPPGTTSAELHVENGVISFTANGTPYSVSVPNGDIVFTQGATSESASYDPTDNDWDVSVPTGGTGNVFLGGVALPVTAALPGNIKNVTWSASFWSDTANLNVNWSWGAAVYTSLGTDPNSLAVKPADNAPPGTPPNSDKAGTPETFKAAVVAGGTGTGITGGPGGNNYTGYTGGPGSPSAHVTPTLGDGLQDYPYPSSNPLTSVAFNESTVLRAANLDATNGYFDLWYSDEHAMALGVRQVNVITSSGTTTTNYPLTALTANPGSATNPQIGTTATTGDQAGIDPSGRLIAPSLYITDTTGNPNSRSGDWQSGGSAYAPSQVFGTWKGVVKTVNYTNNTTTVTCDADPATNSWNLGAGADAPPAGTTNEGYGTEVRWNLTALYNAGVLLPGHSYRFYVIVHDGDQNKSGGDCGQASYNYTYPGLPASQLATVSGFVQLDNGPGVLATPLAGVTVTLTGTTTAGQTVTLTTTTDINGYYSFGTQTYLLAGTYSITQTPPANFFVESATLGTDNGAQDGSLVDNGFVNVVLNGGDNGINYDFLDATASGPGS